MRVLFIFLGVMFLMAPLQGRAEGAAAGGSIEQAFQREYAYLAAQREALTRQTRQIESKTAADAAAGRKQTQELSGRLARLQAENDALFAGVQDAERIRREERNREEQLQASWRKAKRVIEETRHALRFESGKPEVQAVPPERLVVDDLARLGEEAIQLSGESSKLARFRGSYLGQEEHLVESDLYRLGRVAVFARTQQGVKLLGPDGKGSLRVVEGEGAGSAGDLLDRKAVGSVPVYLFESLQDRLTVKKPSGFSDKLADMVPLLFLGLLFLMVGFLFAQLARS